jgi:hypothetical protein
VQQIPLLLNCKNCNKLKNEKKFSNKIFSKNSAKNSSSSELQRLQQTQKKNLQKRIKFVNNSATNLVFFCFPYFYWNYLPLTVLNQLWACLLNNNLIILFFNVKNIWFYITFSLTLSSTEPTCEFQFWNLFNSHVSCLHDQLVLFHYFN